MRSSTLIAGCFALAVKAVIPNDFQQAQGACLEKCHVADVNCQTKCVQVSVTHIQTQNTAKQLASGWRGSELKEHS